MRVDEREIGVPGERRPAADALEEHAGQRVLVAAPIRRVALDLLRGDVAERARQPRVGREAVRRRDGSREAEVREHAAAVVEEDVGRLDIPMYEARSVGGVERRGHGCQRCRRLGRVERAGGEPVRERPARDVAHREEEPAVVLARGVDRHDPRVLELGGEPRLGQETATEPLVIRQRRRHQLQGDRAAECRIAREVHGAHATRAEQTLDREAGDLHAGGKSLAHTKTIQLLQAA